MSETRKRTLSAVTQYDEAMLTLMKEETERAKREQEAQLASLRFPFPEMSSAEIIDFIEIIETKAALHFAYWPSQGSFAIYGWTDHWDATIKLGSMHPIFKDSPWYVWMEQYVEIRRKTSDGTFALQWIKEQFEKFALPLVDAWNLRHTAFVMEFHKRNPFQIIISKETLSL